MLLNRFILLRFVANMLLVLELSPKLTLAQTRIFWLDAMGFVYASNPDGTARQTVVSGSNNGLNGPDGVAVDPGAGKVYWSNMAEYTPNGSMQRANLNGTGIEYVVPVGKLASTPKQIQLDLVHGKIYWCSREGFVIQRCNLNGSQLETLVTHLQNPVGIALDVGSGFFYWSDRNAGIICRAHLEIPTGQTAAARNDIDTLFKGLTRPIDLALDLTAQKMYWTDRGEGSIHRAGMHIPVGQIASSRTDNEILIQNLQEPIGIALDVLGRKIFYTELGGKLDRANLDGTGSQTLWQKTGGAGFTGITFVDLTPPLRITKTTRISYRKNDLIWIDILGKRDKPGRNRASLSRF